jgi:hypothetical protein
MRNMGSVLNCVLCSNVLSVQKLFPRLNQQLFEAGISAPEPSGKPALASATGGGVIIRKQAAAAPSTAIHTTGSVR